MISATARDLAARLSALLASEHGAIADFVLALAEFDHEERWKEFGYATLFDFLHRELRLSRGTAYYRQTAARLVLRFPQVAEALRDGRLCFTAIVELSRVMDEQNQAEVLPRFFHMSKQEAKAVAAEVCPREHPPVREVITALPVASAPRAMPAATIDRGLPLRAGTDGVQPVGRELPTPAPEPARPQVEPLDAELVRLHLTVSRRLLAKIAALKEERSHAAPNATTEEILEAAVDFQLAAEARRKSLVENPRPAPPPREKPEPGCRDSRHVPAAVEREVRLRDQGRCQYRLENGESCGSTHQVELHHLTPHADGGAATVDDLSLRCKAHHRVESEREFGDGLITHCIQQRRRGAGVRFTPALPLLAGIPETA